MSGSTDPKRKSGICEPTHKKDMHVSVMKSLTFIWQVVSLASSTPLYNSPSRARHGYPSWCNPTDSACSSPFRLAVSVSQHCRVVRHHNCYSSQHRVSRGAVELIHASCRRNSGVTESSWKSQRHEAINKYYLRTTRRIGSARSRKRSPHDHHEHGGEVLVTDLSSTSKSRGC
jgi:hypothetical protein